jgi:hypothetical protein
MPAVFGKIMFKIIKSYRVTPLQQLYRDVELSLVGKTRGSVAVVLLNKGRTAALEKVARLPSESKKAKRVLLFINSSAWKLSYLPYLLEQLKKRDPTADVRLITKLTGAPEALVRRFMNDLIAENKRVFKSSLEEKLKVIREEKVMDLTDLILGDDDEEEPYDPQRKAGPMVEVHAWAPILDWLGTGEEAAIFTFAGVRLSISPESEEIYLNDAIFVVDWAAAMDEAAGAINSGVKEVLNSAKVALGSSLASLDRKSALWHLSHATGDILALAYMVANVDGARDRASGITLTDMVDSALAVVKRFSSVRGIVASGEEKTDLTGLLGNTGDIEESSADPEDVDVQLFGGIEEKRPTPAGPSPQDRDIGTIDTAKTKNDLV